MKNVQLKYELLMNNYKITFLTTIVTNQENPVKEHFMLYHVWNFGNAHAPQLCNRCKQDTKQSQALLVLVPQLPTYSIWITSFQKE